MQMEILKSQGRLDQNLRFLYLLLPGLALFLTKGKDLLLFTIVTNELVVELQGGLSMMRFFRPPTVMAAVGDFEISRQARPELERFLYLLLPSHEISKSWQQVAKNTSLTVLPVATLAPPLRALFAWKRSTFSVLNTQ